MYILYIYAYICYIYILYIVDKNKNRNNFEWNLFCFLSFFFVFFTFSFRVHAVCLFYWIQHHWMHICIGFILSGGMTWLDDYMMMVMTAQMMMLMMMNKTNLPRQHFRITTFVQLLLHIKKKFVVSYAVSVREGDRLCVCVVGVCLCLSVCSVV